MSINLFQGQILCENIQIKSFALFENATLLLDG